MEGHATGGRNSREKKENLAASPSPLHCRNLFCPLSFAASFTSGGLSRAAARIAEKIWLTFRVSALEKSLPSKLPSFPPLSLHLPARDEMPAFLAAFRYQHKEKRREGRKYCVKVGITREGALPTREEVLVSLHRELHYNVTKLTYRSCMMQLVQTTWLKSSITLECDDMERRFSPIR